MYRITLIVAGLLVGFLLTLKALILVTIGLITLLIILVRRTERGGFLDAGKGTAYVFLFLYVLGPFLLCAWFAALLIYFGFLPPFPDPIINFIFRS